MPAQTAPTELDAVVVGAGFAGMYMLHRLRERGLTVRAFETGDDVGGTWYWNRYPGARCDVESVEYQYGFSEEIARGWNWTERYAAQPEIIRYADYVAQRLDLRRDIQFKTRVTAASYDEAARRWTVETDQGDRVSAQFCIMATGCLSASRIPDIPGRDDFRGKSYHTGAWPHEGVDFTGQRVAVIGTGSSGIQSIPLIAEQAAHVTVFQRTPNFSLPARNGPIDPDHEARVRADYLAHAAHNKQTKSGTQSRFATGHSIHEVDEAERTAAFEHAWKLGGAGLAMLYRDVMSELPANKLISDFVAGKIREIVDDEQTAALLTPSDYPFGSKRLCLDTDYFATFNRDNVELVDVSQQRIERITAQGVQVGDRKYPADLIVFATGFDAMTGSLLAMNVTGRKGLTLQHAWRDGPTNYLGLMMAGFPNLFTVNGPGSPSVLVNMLVTIEHHIDWITDCIEHMQDKGIATIEPDQQSETAWSAEVQAVGAKTLYPLAKSWYMGDNVPGKPRRFLCYAGGFASYAARCAEIADDGYEGFILRPPAAAAQLARPHPEEAVK